MTIACDPIALFIEEYERAKQLEPFDASRGALATSDRTGEPSVRFVLLKAVNHTGFVFYTNFESAKAQDLDDNPRAALAFHWHTTGVQMRVRGDVLKVSDEEADAYFATRERRSQLGAWASRQSAPLNDRKKLDDEVTLLDKRFRKVSVPRPPFWGGYRIVPSVIELWKSRDDRLHDRWRYERLDSRWQCTRLYP